MKILRFVFVLTFLIGFVALGTTGVSWAAKLTSGNQVSGSVTENNVLPAGNRPQGTVNTTPTCVNSDKPGKFILGSIATWIIENVPGGTTYNACVAKEEDLPAKVPGNLLTSPITLTMTSGNTFDSAQQVCFPVVPGKEGYAYYWDGKTWVKTEDANNGQACVTVPVGSPNPTYVGMCEDK